MRINWLEATLLYVRLVPMIYGFSGRVEEEEVGIPWKTAIAPVLPTTTFSLADDSRNLSLSG